MSAVQSLASVPFFGVILRLLQADTLEVERLLADHLASRPINMNDPLGTLIPPYRSFAEAHQDSAIPAYVSWKGYLCDKLGALVEKYPAAVTQVTLSLLQDAAFSPWCESNKKELSFFARATIAERVLQEMSSISVMSPYQPSANDLAKGMLRIASHPNCPIEVSSALICRVLTFEGRYVSTETGTTSFPIEEALLLVSVLDEEKLRSVASRIPSWLTAESTYLLSLARLAVAGAPRG